MPPEPDAAGVAGMEEVLATAAEAYDPKPPVRWMDAPPVPLLKETRGPLAATPTPGTRGDAADERPGTASLFMFAEPRAGCRPAPARERRTQADGAIEGAQMVETRSPAGA
jgi:hypothetical protein